MNRTKGLRYLTASVVLISSIFFGIACSDDEPSPPPTPTEERYDVSGSASADQIVPPDSSLATGNISGTYSADSNMLHYTINWNGLSGDVTDANFYGPADTGSTAAALISIPITTNGVDGSAIGSIALPDTTENFLLNGKLYYRMNTALYPNGEIRGQIATSPQ